MTELTDVCGGSVTADFQARDSAQSFLTVHVPLYVSYICVTAPRGWASPEHRSEMEFSFFYDTVLWRTGEPEALQGLWKKWFLHVFPLAPALPPES
ncbi:extracellular matrix protein FRAS1-like [Cyanistes caeruleus]|uniref:extracellular matrix protein FRAS1-like n=1 Tax=Cyanistes caeruleus TaxID=156563 RepID=UPI000CDB750C|nr:extracellular matrix protein FRAS1-like [Cyanistes caeruleus]